MPIYNNPGQNAPVLTAPPAGPQPGPQVSPDDMLDATIQLHQHTFVNQWQQIDKAALPKSHRQQMLMQLQNQYDAKKTVLQGQKQQLLAVRQLKEQGALNDDDAMRASWRVVLPNDVEQIVAPKPRQVNAGVPLSPSEYKKQGYDKAMDDIIEPLKGPNRRGTLGATTFHLEISEAAKIPPDQLRNAYFKFASQSGLADLPYARNKQVNEAWDRYMQEDLLTKDTWDPNHPDILAMRPTGALQKIMASSMTNRVLPRTPLGQSVQNANQGITQRLRREEPSKPAYANELKDVAPGESSVGTSNAVAAGTPGPTPAPAVPSMPAPKSKAEYDAIPRGTKYREPSGKVNTKR